MRYFDRRNFDKTKDLPATDRQRAAWREVFSQAIEGGPIARGFDSYFGTDVPKLAPLLLY